MAKQFEKRKAMLENRLEKTQIELAKINQILKLMK